MSDSTDQVFGSMGHVAAAVAVGELEPRWRHRPVEVMARVADLGTRMVQDPQTQAPIGMASGSELVAFTAIALDWYRTTADRTVFLFLASSPAIGRSTIVLREADVLIMRFPEGAEDAEG